MRKLRSDPRVIPRSSRMSFMLTSRLGATISSFIRASRSVPPANTSASVQLLPSRPTACSLVVGLAYSNARILFASLLLVQSCQHSIGRERKIRHSHADRIGYCVRDRGARRNYRRFSESDHPALVVTLAGHHMNGKLAYVRD